MEFEDFDDDLLNDLEDMPASSSSAATAQQHHQPGKPKVADSSQQQAPTWSFAGNSSGAKVGALGKFHGDQMRAVMMLFGVGTHRIWSFFRNMPTDDDEETRFESQAKGGGEAAIRPFSPGGVDDAPSGPQR
jgi:hypothetical protein